MKKFGFLFLLFPFVLSSQDFDESFLNSLPDDIKEDLIKKSGNKISDSESKYRASQFSSKLNIEEDLLELKKELEENLIELNRRLSNDEVKINKYELELFGSNFFNTFQTSFMPINEPSPDSSYILDYGDVLSIQLIGQEDYIENFEIQGDGSINLPKIGKIILAGQTLNEAIEIIKSKVSSVLIGSKAFIGIDRLRDVNILVSGNASKPGVYTLSGNSNILHALNVAGGINEFGSYREINLLRNNKIIETLDIYELLIDGSYGNNKRLRSGDVVFVEMRKEIVSINGAVKRPAKYEVSSDQNLDSLIRYSGGLKQTADLESIFLERILDGTLKSLPIRNVSQFEKIKPVDGDLIYVREHPFREVSVSGAIYKPGTYLLAEGETINDLLKKAGGFTNNAYPFGAIYENDDAKAINKKAKEVLYNEFLDNIIAMSQQTIGDTKFDPIPIIELIQKLQESEPNGRIIVDIVDESKQSQNVRSGDSLIIPEKTNIVYVYGEINTEGAVMYAPNEDANYFIEKSGGLKKFADDGSIYILHPNGETQSYSKKRNIFESQPSSSIKIFPGSIIYIPREMDERAANTLATQAYVSILGNLGIALASLSSINNN